MQKWQSLSVVGLFVAGSSLALPAYAQQNQYPSSTQQSGTSSSQPPGMSQRRQSGPTGSSQPQIIGSSYTAEVSGQVTSVDKQSGKLTVRTVDGDVAATFPPVAVQHVDKGDQVTMAIGLMESNPSASPRSNGSPSSSGSMGSNGANGSAGSMGSSGSSHHNGSSKF